MSVSYSQGRGNNRSNSSYNSRNRSRNNNYRGNRRGGNSRNSNRGRFQGQHIDRAMFISQVKVTTTLEEQKYAGVNFTDFNLDYRILKNLEFKNFKTTTEIQEKAIPAIIAGQDVLGISSTGSGKTGAFLLPMIDKLLKDQSQKLLIIAPTRELALQIMKEAMSLIRGTHLQMALVIGGESMGRQISQLQRGGDIIVGTPGRLNDLTKRQYIRLSDYNNIVVDEVDKMLDMGFIDDIRNVFNQLNPKKQSLFFSATLNKKVQQITESFCTSFELIKLAENKPSESVTQEVIDYYHPDEKIGLLKELLSKEETEKVIIFVDTKRYADKVDQILYESNFKVGVIHGDKRQNVRKRVIQSFKYSKINILVATNVAARGLDIDDITHVINLDQPQSYDEYIHRIGRTGRNGKTGKAYTFYQASHSASPNSGYKRY